MGKSLFLFLCQATKSGVQVDNAERIFLHGPQLHDGRVNLSMEMYVVKKVGTQSTLVDFVIK